MSETLKEIENAISNLRRSNEENKRFNEWQKKVLNEEFFDEKSRKICTTRNFDNFVFVDYSDGIKKIISHLMVETYKKDFQKDFKKFFLENRKLFKIFTDYEISNEHNGLFRVVVFESKFYSKFLSLFLSYGIKDYQIIYTAAKDKDFECQVNLQNKI